MLKQGGTQDISFQFSQQAPNALGANSGGVASNGAANPVIGFEDVELYFDSVYRSTSGSDLPNGLISFDISPLNNNNPLSNIIQLHIGNFYFPRVTNPRTQTDNTNYPSLTYTPNSPDIFFYRRMYIQVTNLPFAQSVKTGNNNSYTFEMQIDELNSNAVKLTPIKQSFFLPRPITSLSEIQLRFLVPQSLTGSSLPVNLHSETYQIQMIAPGTNPARFRITSSLDGRDALLLYTPPAIFQNRNVAPDTGQIPLPVFPVAGVAVFITGFNGLITFPPPTGTIANQDLQAILNSPAGHFITNVVNTSAPTASPRYQFEIAIDGQIGGGINLPSQQDDKNFNVNSATMVVAQKRFALPIRFTGIKDSITNYITVTHS